MGIQKYKLNGFSLEIHIKMSYVKIWIHSVWGTKNREPLLSKEIRKDLFRHIKENGKEKDIYIDSINGHLDHVHCLMALNADLTIAKAMQLIKGESTFWANKNKLVKPKLEWADEYFAVSISESMVENVRNYIKNQEEHHKKITFQQEYNEFIKKYKFYCQC
jgi:REP element-mobilizing transposase RayT